MKRTILVAFVSVMLVACGNDSSDSASDSESTQPVVIDVEADVPPPSEFSSDTEALVFTFQHHFRYDRTRPKPEGRTERQVLVELLGDDVASARGEVDAFMEERGYRGYQERDDRGGIRLDYAKDGAPTVSVRVWPPGAGPVELQAEGATGSVYFSWDLPQTGG